MNCFDKLKKVVLDYLDDESLDATDIEFGDDFDDWILEFKLNGDLYRFERIEEEPVDSTKGFLDLIDKLDHLESFVLRDFSCPVCDSEKVEFDIEGPLLGWRANLRCKDCSYKWAENSDNYSYAPFSTDWWWKDKVTHDPE